MYTIHSFGMQREMTRKSTRCSRNLKSFVNRRNVSYERYVFFSRAQDSGESIDQYVTVLKRLCESCDFGTLRNYLIKDRIELGINNHETRGRLLREPDFTLEKALELVRAAEATEKHMIAINNDVTVHGIHNRRRKLTAKKTNPSQPEKNPSTQPQRRSTFNCRNCGTKHGKKEMSRYRKNLPSLSEAKSFQEHVPVKEDSTWIGTTRRLSTRRNTLRGSCHD